MYVQKNANTELSEDLTECDVVVVNYINLRDAVHGEHFLVRVTPLVPSLWWIPQGLQTN